MKKSMYGNLLRAWTASVLAVLAVGCTNDNDEVSPVPQPVQKSIVILYENDVHCGIDGYTKYVGLRDAIVKADTSYVGLVSCGDFLQGALPGAISHGQYIVDIMKKVGYDAITLGNHEFDYLVPQMMKMLPQIGAPVVCTNFYDMGKKEFVYPGYVIKSYGDKKIAFVGTLTPETMRSEGYAFFDKNQNKIYDLCTDKVYSLVQEAVDKARGEGADYVVVLSHLGEAASETGINSHGLVEATNGIDVVLDGHTHSVIPCDMAINKDGKMIPVTQTGTQFANVGKLWISPDGTFHTMLIPDAENPYTNAAITATVDSIKALLDKATNEKMASSDYDLPAKDADGAWIVRNQETALGNIVADAFRTHLDAEIGLMNGGGLRNGIKAGTISYGDVFSVLPNDNKMCLITATGAEIKAMLTKCTEKWPQLDGSFPQLSGMRFTLHTQRHEVTDVEVYDKKSATYQPLHVDSTYTIATNDYYYGGGFYRTLQNCPLIRASDLWSRDMLAKYLKETLQGVVPERYQGTEGRINLIND